MNTLRMYIVFVACLIGGSALHGAFNAEDATKFLQEYNYEQLQSLVQKISKEDCPKVITWIKQQSKEVGDPFLYHLAVSPVLMEHIEKERALYWHSLNSSALLMRAKIDSMVYKCLFASDESDAHYEALRAYSATHFSKMITMLPKASTGQSKDFLENLRVLFSDKAIQKWGSPKWLSVCEVRTEQTWGQWLSGEKTQVLVFEKPEAVLEGLNDLIIRCRMIVCNLIFEKSGRDLKILLGEKDPLDDITVQQCQAALNQMGLDTSNHTASDGRTSPVIEENVLTALISLQISPPECQGDGNGSGAKPVGFTAGQARLPKKKKMRR